MFVRNSQVLGVCHQMVADKRVSLRAVALAGRGITAGALNTVWTLDVGKPSLSGEELADALIEFGELVAALVELWRRFQAEEIPEPHFEERLEAIVVDMERWLTERNPGQG